MDKYKVLVVDDSALMRTSITKLIEKNLKFKVIGTAANGIEALERTKELKPDLITLDVEMGGMNGIDALTNIMKDNPTPVVMLSDYTPKGAKLTIEALHHGALECFLKSEMLFNKYNRELMEDFYHRLESAATANVKQRKKHFEVAFKSKNVFQSHNSNYEILFIGCSTGGPKALQVMLPKLPKNFPIPVVIAQHMPKGFTASLAERLNDICAIHVKEAEDGEILEGGIVYICPSGYQTVVKKQGSHDVIEVIKDIKHIYNPSVDITLSSLVPIYKNKIITLILTGMGKDGLMGCEKAYKEKGYVITESEHSSVVYGMPKAVQNAGFSHESVDICEMHQRVLALLTKNNQFF